jgi:hypothetical protein
MDVGGRTAGCTDVVNQSKIQAEIELVQEHYTNDA